jgi:phage gp36-like protein
MSYSVEADVRALLPKATTTVVTPATIAALIAKADAIIDSKISAHYTLPLAKTPKIVASISADIAAYYVMRSQFTQDGQNKNKWLDDYKAALNLLDEMSGGNMLLLDPDTNQPMPNIPNLLSSSTSGYQPTFDVDAVEGSVVDPARLTDVASRRDTQL